MGVRRNGIRFPVCHFLDDETKCADAFLFFKVVVVRGRMWGEEEGIVGRAGGGCAVGGDAGEKRGVWAVDGASAVSAEGRRGRRGGRTGGRKRQFGEDKVVLVLDPGVDAGVACGGVVGEELSEERRVCGVVFGHVLHIQETNPRVETSEKNSERLASILFAGKHRDINEPTEPFPRSTRRLCNCTPSIIKRVPHPHPLLPFPSPPCPPPITSRTHPPSPLSFPFLSLSFRACLSVIVLCKRVPTT